MISSAQILNICSDKIELNMNMSQENFAKARLLQYMTEPGYIAKIIENKVKFEPYYFLETAAEKSVDNQSNIKIVANGFLGKSFYDILNQQDNKQEQCKVFNLLNKIFCSAIESNINLSFTSPLFTIISQNYDCVLFLPQELCSRSLLNFGDDVYSYYLGCYNNPGLSIKDNINFILSCYAYKIITNKLPYNELNTEIRIEDYYDGNFIPLEYTEECKNTEYGKLISFNLNKGTSKGRKLENSKEIPDLNDFFIITSTSLSEKDKNEKKQNLFNKNNKKIKFLRKCRKNSFALKTLAFVLCSVIVLIIGFFAGRSTPPDIRGLTSYQVVETAFTAFSKLDVQLFTCCIETNRNTRKFEEIMANFYTTGKMRSAYEVDAGTLPPNQWFHLKNQKQFSNYWTFGLTNLKINGNSANLSSEDYKINKKQKLPFIKEENNKILKKGDTIKYDLTYFMIYHETLKKLFVNEYTTEVTLVFNGKRWKISNIEDNYMPLQINTKDFNNKFNNYLSKENDIYKVMNLLRVDYPWLPTQKELEAGNNEVKKFFTQLYTVKKE